jgi:hypothetical protein
MPSKTVILTIRGVALGSLLAMGLALAYAWRHGDFLSEAGAIVDLPWGIVTLLDAYIGFILIGCWIVFREASLRVGALWVGSILVLGNLVSCIYVLLASLQAEGDLRRFWLGFRADPTRGP